MFNNKQIEIIEDKVVNKILYPIATLTKMYNGGVITDKQLITSMNSLTELYTWVYSLRS